jgi:vancomycin resistance protein YoaR
MSETGIYSSRYELLRRFGDLLDEVLLRVHAGNSSPEDPERKELAKLLIKAAVQPTPDLAAIHLAILLSNSEQEALSQWAEIGRTLQNPDLPSSAVQRLEKLAYQLDAQRTEAVAKMRGASTR